MAWLGTLLIGGVLIAGGFGAGVLLGVVTEEPAVLAGYWTGLSERVDLAVANPAELPPKQPAGALEAGGAAAAQNQPLAASASTLPAVGAPPSGFAVQVGAFSSSEAARSMRARLEGGGYESFVAAAAASRDRRWRVRVGPFTTRDEAHRTASRLERREGLSTWVVSLGHGS
jgi:cell division septation protein DedD